MNRYKAQQIAEDTVAIIGSGGYTAPNGRRVNLGTVIEQSVLGTGFYPNGAEPALKTAFEPEVEFRNETSLQAGARLVKEGFTRVGILNFASAKHPGGGFLNGAIAQEESLARSSGLYASLKAQGDFYKTHSVGYLYTDATIYTPGCPVFKDDEGNLLDEPYCVDFITCAAPNLSGVYSYDHKIPSILNQRAKKIIGAAVDHDCDALVLGAWGCGVFRNDPVEVATAFQKALREDGAGNIQRISFSIIDQKFVDVFERVIR